MPGILECAIDILKGVKADSTIETEVLKRNFERVGNLYLKLYVCRDYLIEEYKIYTTGMIT